MSSDKSFDNILLKLKRAKRHYDELKSEVNSFLSKKPYKIEAKRDSETKRPVYVLSEVEESPSSLPLITADIIHNLRSALDQLAHQLVVIGKRDKGPFKHVSFPIAKSKSEYKNQIKQKTKGMETVALELIDEVKPYRGGNDLSWKLHELNIIDKHRLLITVGSTYKGFDAGRIFSRMLENTEFGNEKKIPKIELYIGPSGKYFPLKKGDKLFSDYPNAPIDEKLQFKFSMVFDEPGVLEGEPIDVTLKSMIEEVENIIFKFEHLLN